MQVEAARALHLVVELLRFLDYGQFTFLQIVVSANDNEEDDRTERIFKLRVQKQNMNPE